MDDDLGLRHGDDSPWADDVPSAAPVEFEWSSRDPQPGADPTPPTAAEQATEERRTSERNSGGVDRRAPWASDETGARAVEPPSSRTKIVVAVAVLGVLAIGAASLLAGRGGTDTADSADPGDTTAPTVAASDAPAATTEQLAPVETESAPPSTESTSVVPQAGTDGPTRPGVDDEATWASGRFVVPEPLRDLEATTTIVVVTRNGILRELDLPSGNTREIDVGPVFGFNQFLVGRSSTLLSGDSRLTDRPSAVLYRAGFPPVDLGPESAAAAVFFPRPSSDEFTGYLFGTGPDDYLDLLVQADGNMTTTPASVGDGRVPWLRRYAPNGNELFTRGGATYEERPDGSVALVTHGEVLSYSSHHLLVRECDDDYVCTEWLIDGETGERRPAVIGPEFVEGRVGDAQVSPDGNKLWFVWFGAEPSELIMDLSTGQTIDIGASSLSGQGGQLTSGTHVWTADGSGIIRSAVTALEYVDATTGATTSIGDEFSSPVMYGVRLDLNPVPPPNLDGTVDSGIQIAGYGDSTTGVSGVHRIDIDTGEIISVDVDPIQSGAPVFVVADPVGISAVSYDNVDGIRVEGDSVSSITVDSLRGPMLAGPRPDTLWVPQENGPLGHPTFYELFDSLGRPADGQLRLPKDSTGASGSDGAGGVVAISTLGGAFIIDQAGAERITTGDLLALGPSVAIADECDDGFVCGTVSIDRATGERTTLEPSLLTASIGVPPQLVGSGRTVDPTGQVAVVFNRVTENYMFADLVTGAVAPAPDIDVLSTIAWSDDGRAAVFLADGVLQLYERSKAGVRPLTRFPELRAFSELAPVDPSA